MIKKSKHANSHLDIVIKKNNFSMSKRSTRVFNQMSNMKCLPDSKRSQAWGMDLCIAMIIFSIGFIVLIIYSTNNSDDVKEKMENLEFDGEFLMNNLFSSGYPMGWDSSNLVTIGIVDNGKINDTKLKMFYELANNDYDRTKKLFNTRYDYYFFFSENITINSLSIEGIGKPGFDKNNINADNLIKITRFTIYKEKPTNAYLYIMG